jgi:hypothetical protein
MSGKVFHNSANIYQDQARLLFDYYKQAAEKIVGEEEQYEKEIAQLKSEIAQLEQEYAKHKRTKTICTILCFLLIPLYFLIKAHLQMKELTEKIGSARERVAEFERLHREIFRDYTVSRIGVGYIPIARQIPFEDKSFLLDYTDSVGHLDFNLQTLKQPELFTETVGSLEKLIKEAPIVEGSEEPESVDTGEYSLSIQQVTYHDYLGKIDRTIRTASYCLSDMSLTSVSLPVVMPDSDRSKFIREHCTSDPGNAPVFSIFDEQKYQKEIERFHSLNEMKRALEDQQVQFEEVLKKLMISVADSVQAITQAKLESATLLADGSNKILFKILKSAYNHYSPHLEMEEIERIRQEKFDYQESSEEYQLFQLKPSSKLKYDLLSGCWMAEDGSRTNFPFGVHHIHEEIVAPIVQNLMQESRLERLKIYNHIKDQKTNYLNQWHQETMDFYARNRAESNDLINIMRSTLSEYIASFNAMMALSRTQDDLEKNASIDAAFVKTADNEGEVFEAFEAKSRDFKAIQEDFQQYMERLKEDIDRRAEKFQHIEYYDASLRDGAFKDYAVASGRVNQLEPRRMPLAAVNPFFAESTELPPVPSMEKIAVEHQFINLPKIARQELERLDAEGETH